MNWNFVEKLKDEDSIKQVENSFAVVFPEEFKSLVMQYNNGTAVPTSLVINIYGYTVEKILYFDFSCSAFVDPVL